MVDLVLLILKSLAILLMKMIKSGMEILKIMIAFNIIVFLFLVFHHVARTHH